MSEENDPQQSPEQQPDMMRHLVAERPRQKNNISPFYSRTVRWLRLALPLIALGLTAVVFTWNSNTQVAMIADKNDKKIPTTVGKNELLNPRFEGADQKGQPYTLTATRAVQEERLRRLEQDLPRLAGHRLQFLDDESRDAETRTTVTFRLRGPLLLSGHRFH